MTDTVPLPVPDVGWVFVVILAPNIQMAKRHDGAWFFRDTSLPRTSPLRRWTRYTQSRVFDLVKTSNRARLPTDA